MKPVFPKKLSREFLLVDLVNNLDQLGENPQEVLERVKDRLSSSDTARLNKAAQTYGSERAKKFFARALAEVSNSRPSGSISANTGPGVRKLVAGDLDRPFDDLHLEGLVDQSTGRHVVKRGVE